MQQSPDNFLYGGLRPRRGEGLDDFPPRSAKIPRLSARVPRAATRSMARRRRRYRPPGNAPPLGLSPGVVPASTRLPHFGRPTPSSVVRSRPVPLRTATSRRDRLFARFHTRAGQSWRTKKGHDSGWLEGETAWGMGFSEEGMPVGLTGSNGCDFKRNYNAGPKHCRVRLYVYRTFLSDIYLFFGTRALTVRGSV